MVRGLLTALIAALRAKGDSSVRRKHEFWEGLALGAHLVTLAQFRAFVMGSQNERNRAGARFLAFMGETFVNSKAIHQ